MRDEPGRQGLTDLARSRPALVPVLPEAALDAGHVGAIDVSQIRQHFLREALLPAQLPDYDPEVSEDWVRRFGHV